jgi:hypothetical protein
MIPESETGFGKIMLNQSKLAILRSWDLDTLNLLTISQIRSRSATSMTPIVGGLVDTDP